MIKMVELLKIPLLEELLSFIPNKKRGKICQNNKYLYNKLNILSLKKKTVF